MGKCMGMGGGATSTAGLRLFSTRMLLSLTILVIWSTTLTGVSGQSSPETTATPTATVSISPTPSKKAPESSPSVTPSQSANITAEEPNKSKTKVEVTPMACETNANCTSKGSECECVKNMCSGLNCACNMQAGPQCGNSSSGEALICSSEKFCAITGIAATGKKNLPGSSWGIGVAVFIVLAIIAAIAAAVILRKRRARAMPIPPMNEPGGENWS